METDLVSFKVPAYPANPRDQPTVIHSDPASAEPVLYQEAAHARRFDSAGPGGQP